jgi:D-alanyl-D-alanine carboxypeptidase (penicillin-binding protein 5/6)
MVGVLPSSEIKSCLDKVILNRLAFQSTVGQEIKTKMPVPLPPSGSQNLSQISVGSSAAYFEDYETSKVIYAKNESTKLPMASTTKLMTALVGVKRYKPDDILIVPNLKVRPLSAIVGLTPGSRVHFKEVLAGLLIESGADAALTIAVNVSGSEEKFVSLMNAEAQNWGLENTHFTNSVGYDDHGHYSTALDLARMAKIGLVNPLISDFVSRSTYQLTDVSGQKLNLINTNKLLTKPQYKGIKTGTTYEAGQCFIVLYIEENKKIIGVLMNSPERFIETEKIIQWTRSNFLW